MIDAEVRPSVEKYKTAFILLYSRLVNAILALHTVLCKIFLKI